MIGRRRSIDWAEAVRLYRAGQTYAEIAAGLGCAIVTVRMRLRARGVRARRKNERMTRRHGVRLYHAWHFLLGRCEDPEHRDYAAYGGRGVRFAPAWHDFDTFYDWAIGAGYRPGLRLDRRNRSLDFTPANCCWVDGRTLLSGRPGRPTVLVEAFGQRKSRAAWARDRRCRVSRGSLAERLAAGWPPDEAISAPPGARPARRVRPVAIPVRRGPPGRIDWDVARALHEEQGLSTAELARRFGATPGGIVRGFQRLGVRLHRRPTHYDDRGRRNAYHIWVGLHRRCEDPRDRLYRFHGARGVRVARAWREFEPFLEWVRASGARPGLWLTRKDRRKGWSAGNCEWVLPVEAVRRQGPRARPRPRRIITAFGETKGLAAWCRDRRCRVRDHTVGRRLAKGWPAEDAISQPRGHPGSAGSRFAELRAFGETKSKTEWLHDGRCGGVCMAGLNDRLRRGWTAQDAIATPPWRQPGWTKARPATRR